MPSAMADHTMIVVLFHSSVPAPNPMAFTAFRHTVLLTEGPRLPRLGSRPAAPTF